MAKHAPLYVGSFSHNHYPFETSWDFDDQTSSIIVTISYGGKGLGKKTVPWDGKFLDSQSEKGKKTQKELEKIGCDLWDEFIVRVTNYSNEVHDM